MAEWMYIPVVRHSADRSSAARCVILSTGDECCLKVRDGRVSIEIYLISMGLISSIFRISFCVDEESCPTPNTRQGPTKRKDSNWPQLPHYPFETVCFWSLILSLKLFRQTSALQQKHQPRKTKCITEPMFLVSNHFERYYNVRVFYNKPYLRTAKWPTSIVFIDWKWCLNIAHGDPLDIQNNIG